MSSQSITIDITRYTIANKIGEGCFSKVYRVKDLETRKYYAAKIANIMIDEETQNSEEAKLLFREVNLLSVFNHPSILKFIGYYPTDFEGNPFPTIITELASNGSLRDIIEMEISGLSPDEWGDTKKLINIYGIASGMSYLHAQNILHRDLKPENILIDDFLHPKISDFGLSKITDFISISMNFQSNTGLKGTPIYMAPEIFQKEEYSKPGDVYAFAFIVFEIMTGQRPFNNDKLSLYQLIKIVSIEGFRPEIPVDVPASYRDLIERCWSQKAEDRPSFDMIVENLKNNQGFITKTIDSLEFYDYVDFIDDFKTTFNKEKRLIHFSDFIKRNGRNKTVETFSFYNNEGEDENQYSEPNNNSTQNESKDFENEESATNNSSSKLKFMSKTELDPVPRKIKEIIPRRRANCIVIDAEKKFMDSQIDSIQKHIQGDFTNEDYDLEIASEILSEIKPSQDKRVYCLRGLICLKKNKYSEAVKHFLEGIKADDLGSMYEYGKLLFIGEGVGKNIKESLLYIQKTKNRGYKKGEYFLTAYNDLQKINKFTKLPAETQLFFITNNIDNMMNNDKKQGLPNECEFEKIYFPPMNTEKLYFNKSLKSSIFIDSIKAYKNISIEIKYPSTSFTSINKIVMKIQKRKNCNIAIGIVITSNQSEIPPICFFESFVYFRLTKNINTIKIPSSVTSIRYSFFKGCSSLTQITIPSSVTKIEHSAFKGCSSLTQITIPSYVTKISESSFEGCSSLTQIKIPSSITEIGHSAFKGCSSLTQITITSYVTKISESSFEGCSSLTQIAIPSSITEIGHSAFKGCSSLTQITIPSSVTKIEDYAFSKCSSLTQITIPSSVTKIKMAVFKGCSSLIHIIIPSSVTEIEFSAFQECSSLTHITIPSSVTKIGEYAFQECSSLTHIIIPSSVIEIGEYSFQECSSLTHITIPSSVTKIGEYAFERCSSLAQITIPSSITKIDAHTFEGCSSLTQITIPSSVTEVEDYAFSKCSSLTQITIPSSVTKIKMAVFKGCSSLTHIIIPSSVTEIEFSAFQECSSLTHITIPSSVTKIGEYAFERCSSLAQITIPSSITKIDAHTFEGCSSLTQITIPSSVTEIEDYAFYKCSSLTQITIPSSITKIGFNAFQKCS